MHVLASLPALTHLHLHNYNDDGVKQLLLLTNLMDLSMALRVRKPQGLYAWGWQHVEWGKDAWRHTAEPLTQLKQLTRLHFYDIYQPDTSSTFTAKVSL